MSSDIPGLDFSVVLARCIGLRLHFASEHCRQQMNMLVGIVHFIFASHSRIEGDLHLVRKFVCILPTDVNHLSTCFD